jgi:hypothetical protein
MARERERTRQDWDDADEAPRSGRVLDAIDAVKGDVADLRVAVARIEATLAAQSPKSGLARDGALTISGSALGGAILFVLQHFIGK